MILMVFKPYVFKLRVSGTLNFDTFLHQLVKAKKLEKGAAFNNKQKRDVHLKKWAIVENLLPLQKFLVIYNTNNNTLIETGNSGRGLVLRLFIFHFKHFLFFYLFLPKKCSLQTVVWFLGCLIYLLSL